MKVGSPHTGAELVASSPARGTRQRPATKVEQGLHLDPDRLAYAVCARTTLTNVLDGILALTAADLFSIDLPV